MDLFGLYRRLLMIVCTVYAIVRLIQGILGWRRRLAGPQRHKRLARSYLATLAWSIHLRPFRWELAQIALLTALLIGAAYAHRYALQ
jgi:hypothetical protein